MTDMFAFVTLEGRPKPVPLAVLAWSHGCSNNSSRSYGAVVRPKKPTDEHERKALEWTTAEVLAWLASKEVSAETVAAFKSNDVDGRALLMLGADDLKALVPGSIGERRRLESCIRDVAILADEARNEQQQDAISMQDLSVTVYQGASTQMCFLAPMLAQKKLARVSLIAYTSSGRRNRGWGGNDEQDDVVIPPGTPVAMVDLRDVTVSSWSSGGSGGEDRFTGNVSLSAERSVHTVFGVHDFRHLSWEMQARVLNVDPRDPDWDPEHTTKGPLERAMGVSVIYDGKKGSLVEWGSHVRWTKAMHGVYPVAFKQAVRQLLLATKRREDCDLYKLPKDVLLLIIARLATSYNASPFADYEHPDPDSLKEKEKANEDGEQQGQEY